MGLSAGWTAPRRSVVFRGGRATARPRRAGGGAPENQGRAALSQKPLLLGLAGWSGAGKTTLLCALLPILTKAGLRVSTIKHAHHGVPLDTPRKDSDRHRRAGAREVLLATESGWVLIHAMQAPLPDPTALAARLEPVDLVLVEGFRAGAMPKIEVFRPALGKPALWPGDAGIVALATDGPADDARLAFAGPVFSLSDHYEITRWIMGLIAVHHGKA